MSGEEYVKCACVKCGYTDGFHRSVIENGCVEGDCGVCKTEKLFRVVEDSDVEVECRNKDAEVVAVQKNGVRIGTDRPLFGIPDWVMGPASCDSDLIQKVTLVFEKGRFTEVDVLLIPEADEKEKEEMSNLQLVFVKGSQTEKGD